MTTAFLGLDLKLDEGCELTAYPDPKSPLGLEMAKPMAERLPSWRTLPGAPWTIGYGHTGPEVHEGLVWTQDQADAALLADIAEVKRELDVELPWWRVLNDARQDVLCNLCFNLGWHRLSGFHHMLAFLDGGDYVNAAGELLCSKAAEELPRRYQRLAVQLKSGVRTGIRPNA